MGPLFYLVEKVARPLFRVFAGFAWGIKEAAPGGKTRKVRKPFGFHPF